MNAYEFFVPVAALVVAAAVVAIVWLMEGRR